MTVREEMETLVGLVRQDQDLKTAVVRTGLSLLKLRLDDKYHRLMIALLLYLNDLKKEEWIRPMIDLNRIAEDFPRISEEEAVNTRQYLLDNTPSQDGSLEQYLSKALGLPSVWMYDVLDRSIDPYSIFLIFSGIIPEKGILENFRIDTLDAEGLRDRVKKLVFEYYKSRDFEIPRDSYGFFEAKKEGQEISITVTCLRGSIKVTVNSR